MCWAVYLASDKQLPQIPWNKSARAFNTQELSETDLPVKEKFSYPFVIYIGSHLGCGCGFMAADEDDPVEQTNHKQTVEALSKYLEDMLKGEANLEIYLCWEDEQAQPAIARKILCPSDFLNLEFPLHEKEFATIAPYNE
jgi:hypothetical protein